MRKPASVSVLQCKRPARLRGNRRYQGHGLDRKFGLAIESIELASTEAGKVALRGGSVDHHTLRLVVGRPRTLTRRQSGVLSHFKRPWRRDDCRRDHRSAVSPTLGQRSSRSPAAHSTKAGCSAGLRPQGRRRSEKAGRRCVWRPPLLSQKALQGETDATLTYWNFCADLESRGFQRAISMDLITQSLGAKGPVAVLGYSFDSDWAKRNPSLVERFVEAARDAKEILAHSETEWTRLAPSSSYQRSPYLAVYRQRYSEGLLRRSLTEEEADARTLYSVLAGIGGPQLVGGARELPPGTFYRPPRSRPPWARG